MTPMGSMEAAVAAARAAWRELRTVLALVVAPWLTPRPAEVVEREQLAAFLDRRIGAARELKRGFSTEDERRGSNREVALQDVRVEFLGERLP
jgi:hypothetical protein